MDPLDLIGAGDPSWMMVVMALDRVAPEWGARALRRGILCLLLEHTYDMEQPNASKALVARAQEYVDALNKISWK